MFTNVRRLAILGYYPPTTKGRPLQVKRPVPVIVCLVACLGLWAVPGVWAADAMTADEAFAQGVTLYKLGQFKAAANRFEASLAEEPHNVEAQKWFGDCLFALYDPEDTATVQPVIEAYLKALAADPLDGRIRLRLARIFARANRTPEAVAELETLLEADPDNITALADLAALLARRAATTGRAKELATRLLERRPQHRLANLILARAAFNEDDPAAAVKYFDAYLAREPEDDLVRLDFAEALFRAGRHDEAIRHFNYLAGKDATRHRALQGLARSYFAAERHAEATATADRLLAIDADAPFAWRIKGLVLVALGRGEEAVAALARALNQRPDDNEVLLELARAHAMSPEGHADAVAAYRRMLSRQPDNATVRDELARLYADAGDHEAAAAEYEALVGKQPGERSSRIAWIDQLVAAGDVAQALTQAQQLIEIAPADIGARILEAEMLQATGNHDDALERFSTLYRQQPDSAPVLLGLGRAHERASERFQQQAAEMTAAIENQWFGLFERYRRWQFRRRAARHYGWAIDAFEQAAAHQPKNAAPHLRAGALHARRGKIDAALAELQKAVALEPANVDAHLGQAVLEARRERHDRAVAAIAEAVRAASMSARARPAAGGAADFDDLESHRRLARRHAEHGADQQAIRECEFVLTQDDKDDATRRLLARLLVRRGKTDQASRLFAEMAGRQPDDRLLALEWTDLRLAQGEVETVVAEADERLAANAEDRAATLIRARALTFGGQAGLARSLLQVLSAGQGDDAAIRLASADLHRNAGELEDAVRQYREALGLDPDLAAAHRGLGIIARRRDHLARAFVEQRRACEIDPTDITAQAELTYVLYLLDRDQVAAGDAAAPWPTMRLATPTTLAREAVANPALLAALVREAPDDCAFRLALARRVAADGSAVESVRVYGEVLRRCGGEGVTAQEIARLAPGEGVLTLEVLKLLVSRRPTDFMARRALAEAFRADGDLQAAVDQFLWCVRARPADQAVQRELVATLSLARRGGLQLRPGDLVFSR